MTFVKKKRQSSVKLILWRKKSYFKGKKRLEAKKAYHRLLQLCSDSCSIDEPVYLRRSE